MQGIPTALGCSHTAVLQFWAWDSLQNLLLFNVSIGLQLPSPAPSHSIDALGSGNGCRSRGHAQLVGCSRAGEEGVWSMLGCNTEGAVLSASMGGLQMELIRGASMMLL